MLSQPVQIFKPQFDRSQRQWQTAEGATLAAGPQGRNAERLTAIADARPELADKVVQLGNDPALFSRLLDAAEMILNGNVYQNHVASQTEPDRYYGVAYRFGGYSCNCDSFHYRPVEMSGYGAMCKHTLAIHICYLLQITPAPAPIPFQGEALNFDETDVV